MTNKIMTAQRELILVAMCATTLVGAGTHGTSAYAQDGAQPDDAAAPAATIDISSYLNSNADAPGTVALSTILEANNTPDDPATAVISALAAVDRPSERTRVTGLMGKGLDELVGCAHSWVTMPATDADGAVITNATFAYCGAIRGIGSLRTARLVLDSSVEAQPHVVLVEFSRAIESMDEVQAAMTPMTYMFNAACEGEPTTSGPDFLAYLDCNGLNVHVGGAARANDSENVATMDITFTEPSWNVLGERSLSAVEALGL